MSPNPSWPWTYAASGAWCSSGAAQPAYTGTSTPATSHSFKALATVWRRPTLPAAMVRPTTSWRVSLNAISKANASSTPGSVSISRGIFVIDQLCVRRRRSRSGRGFPGARAPSFGRWQAQRVRLGVEGHLVEIEPALRRKQQVVVLERLGEEEALH